MIGLCESIVSDAHKNFIVEVENYKSQFSVHLWKSNLQNREKIFTFHDNCLCLKFQPKNPKKLVLLCHHYSSKYFIQILNHQTKTVLTKIDLVFPFKTFEMSRELIVLGGRDNILVLNSERLETLAKVKTRGFLTNTHGYKNVLRVKVGKTEIVAVHQNEKYLSIWNFL